MEVVITPSDDWFQNPLDSMPIAKNSPSWEDTAPSEYEPPHDESDDIEATKTLHQKMYEMATKNGSTLNIGGSENASSI